MLNHRIAVYVPSTVNVSESCDNSEQVKAALKMLSGLFGGATAMRATGAWVAESGELVVEAVTICYAYCTAEGLYEHKSNVVAWAEQMRDAMKQECVSVEIDNELHLV